MTGFAFIAILIAGFLGASLVRGSDLKGMAMVVVPTIFVLVAVGLGYILGVNPVKLMAVAGVVAIAAIIWAAMAPNKSDNKPNDES